VARGIIVFDDATVVLRDVEITVNSKDGMGILSMTSGTVTLDHVEIDSTVPEASALFTVGSGTLRARNSSFRGTFALFGHASGPTSFVNSELEGFVLAPGELKCIGSYDAALAPRNADCQAP
jgi:hypothetical protein